MESAGPYLEPTSADLRNSKLNSNLWTNHRFRRNYRNSVATQPSESFRLHTSKKYFDAGTAEASDEEVHNPKQITFALH